MIITTFATGVYISEKTYDISDNEIELIKKENKKLNNGGNSTSTDSYVLNSYTYLKSYVLNELNKLFYNNLHANPKITIDITQSWFNYNKKGSTHHIHNHRNSIFSGIMYLQGLSGTTVFKRPNDVSFANCFDFDIQLDNEHNNREFYINPQIGKLILFPSMLEHYVTENKNDETRITLSFNTFIKGGFGVKERLTKI